jgi:hypothetical protein
MDAMADENTPALETAATQAAVNATDVAQGVGEEATIEGEEQKKSGEEKRTIQISAGAVFIFVFTVLSFLSFGAVVSFYTRDIEIIAAPEKTAAVVSDAGAAEHDGAGWRVTGRVVQGAAPIEGMSIWCVGQDGSGKSYTPHGQRTDANGEFKFDAIPEKLAGGDAVKEIRITAGYSNWLRLFASPTTILLSVGPGGEAVKFSQLNAPWWLLLPPVCFLLTIMVVAGASLYGAGSRFAYYGALSLSLVLTVSTVWFIADAINTFNTSVPHGQVRTLGFLTIFEGSYVENSGTEWLVSLTYPSDHLSSSAVDRTSATAVTVVHGLGAPFWVIFVSVLGAGLLTLILVIQAISNPPEFASLSATAYGDRMRNILEHQFFVLFAPLSGIFVFQLLVIAGAAKEPVTVATIILGAGATLTGLLSKAVKSAQQYLEGNSASGEQREV